jgi:hypothetical protein
VKVGNAAKTVLTDNNGQPLRGDRIVFSPPKEWEGQLVVIMPYFRSAVESVAVKVRVKRMGREVWNGQGYFIKKDGFIEKGTVRESFHDYYFENDDGTVELISTLPITKSSKGYDSVKFSNGLIASIFVTYIQSGNHYMHSDYAAALIGASYAYYKETGRKFYMTQFCSVNGVHSGKGEKGWNADIRYAHKDGNVNVPVWVTHSHYSKEFSQKIVNYLRKYGYNIITGKFWSIITENATGTGAEFEHTFRVSGHKDHIHIQQYNDLHIKKS